MAFSQDAAVGRRRLIWRHQTHLDQFFCHLNFLETLKMHRGSHQDLTGQMASSSGVHHPVTEEYKKSDSKHMALVALMDKTGHQVLQLNGQRKYGGPPPVPLFNTAGTIYELRLMMEFSGDNRGFAFVMYTKKEDAIRAVQMLDHCKVRPGKFIAVYPSQNNCRLFLGNIPTHKSKEEILEEVMKVTEGLQDVIVYPSATGKNPGFAFLLYPTHKEALFARKELIGMRLWGKTRWVNWARTNDRKEAQNPQANVGQALYNPSPSSTAETLQREMEPVGAGAVGGNYGTTIGGHIIEVYGNLTVTPLLPGMMMSYTGLPQLQRDQITSAVSLLELYCGLHNLPPPQYNLFSFLDQRGNLWLVYEVVMPLTHSSFLPCRLCARLDDAKKMAALNALWNLDPSFARDWPNITSLLDES